MTRPEDLHGQWVLLSDAGEPVDADADEAVLRARHPEAPAHAFVPYGPPAVYRFDS